MKRYAITRTDGTVSLMTLVEGVSLDTEISKWADNDRATIFGWREITEDEIPQDRTFRGAWEDGPTGIKVNLEKAKAIQARRIVADNEREERNAARAAKINQVENTLRSITTLEELKGN